MVDCACGWIAVERWAYREMVASEHGPKGALMRLTLIIVSLHMHEDGTGAFPSQASIAKRAGLSERTVRSRLKAAVQQNWLLRSFRGKNQRGWNQYTYTAIIPATLALLLPKRNGFQIDYRHALPVGGREPANTVGRPASDGATTGTPRRDDRHAVPTNSSSNSNNNSPSERPLSRTQEPFTESGNEKKKEGIRRLLSNPENRRRLGTSYVTIRQLPESLRYPGYDALVERLWEEFASRSTWC